MTVTVEEFCILHLEKWELEIRNLEPHQRERSVVAWIKEVRECYGRQSGDMQLSAFAEKNPSAFWMDVCELAKLDAYHNLRFKLNLESRFKAACEACRK